MKNSSPFLVKASISIYFFNVSRWVHLFSFKFIYLFMAALGLCCCAWVFSSCGERGLHSLLWRAGFSLQWLLLLRSTGSRRAGFSSCGTPALERRLRSCGARGLVAPRHVGSSWTRARTRLPCIGRRILNHCATREAPQMGSLLYAIICNIKSLPTEQI